MDFSLKKCCRDRLSSLPDELICQILSSLPTKDAAIASLSSKKMRSAFMYLTTLDFEDSPISYCARKNPQLIERFQIFKTFVDTILSKSRSPHLSKFRLGFGGDLMIKSFHYHRWSRECGKHCFPDLEPTKLNSWICFPLSRCGVREIDLRIHVREPEKLPSAFFTYETLEVLKLDTNLDFELVSSMPSFRLPNLKVLQLRSVLILEDDFVGRLLSNCPLLKELDMDCWWEYGKSVTISSPLLEKLVLSMNKNLQFEDPGDLVSIDTPNLQYFEYEDKLALHYSVASMKAPVQASINVYCDSGTADGNFRSIHTLLRAVCNVQRLSLFFSCLERYRKTEPCYCILSVLCDCVFAIVCMKLLDYEDLENQLPTFHNLKRLEVDTNSSSKWDTVLFVFLMRSPILEVLEFREGIDPMYVYVPDHDELIAESERWFYRKNQVSPYCCKPHLKRIVIKKYRGTIREVELIRFLLENAPALEELLIICKRKDKTILPESTLKKLPMASSTCLIIVQ
ncbi:F-box/LRR-repeat protein At3g58900-like [Silene latifolia]|uniref:F-box/LRR-repeat protein At3g58900-like n=1 Tax=Silene latifolia TaxID=37657 RepID=UPI003D7858B8